MDRSVLWQAELMLKAGLSDERVEQLAAVSLSDIIALRAKFAACPVSPMSASPPKLASWTRP